MIRAKTNCWLCFGTGWLAVTDCRYVECPECLKFKLAVKSSNESSSGEAGGKR